MGVDQVTGAEGGEEAGDLQTAEVSPVFAEKPFGGKVGVDDPAGFGVGDDDDARDVAHDAVKKQFPAFDALLGVAAVSDVAERAVVAEKHHRLFVQNDRGSGELAVDAAAVVADEREVKQGKSDVAGEGGGEFLGGSRGCAGRHELGEGSPDQFLGLVSADGGDLRTDVADDRVFVHRPYTVADGLDQPAKHCFTAFQRGFGT